MTEEKLTKEIYKELLKECSVMESNEKEDFKRRSFLTRCCKAKKDERKMPDQFHGVTVGFSKNCELGTSHSGED